MDTLCTPTIIAGALFVAIIFNDLLRHEFEDLPGHSTLGVVSILLIAGLCQRGAVLVAWGLLLLPLTVFLIILAVQLSNSTTSSVAPVPDTNNGYRGAFMYLGYDFGKGSNATNTPSNSAGTGTGTSGSANLPICSDCNKKKCDCDT